MNIIKNFLVTPKDIDRANDIYGLPVAVFKGKNTLSKSEILSKDSIKIQEEIYLKDYTTTVY